ncbi:MAG TPA: hypothetical protein VNU68_03050 [Verrucomicrobiae bacterium]|nr:hypothetical protein [Verrucomicrobiae bacterium]
MKLAGFFAFTIPELRRLNGAQLLKVWSGCTPFSRPKIYLHIVLLMACASVLFNTAMRLSESFLLDLVGLIIGLSVPPNIYFHFVFKDRRAAIREFIQENWDEFKPQ